MGYISRYITTRRRYFLLIVIIIAAAITLVISTVSIHLNSILPPVTASSIIKGDSDSNNSQSQTIVRTKNYYVDRDVKKEGDGTSWANASKKLSSLNWSNISTGDTIYISGGTDSLVYPPDQVSNISSWGRYIVITKGNDKGHNGEVWFANDEQNSQRYSFSINNCENIKLSRLNFTNRIDTSIFAGYILESAGRNNNIMIDDCHIISPGNAIGLGGANNNYLVVSNCKIEILSNNTDLGQDPVVFGFGNNYTFDHNIFIHRQIGGIDGKGNHGDIVQLVKTGKGGWGQSVISNNIFQAILPPNSVDVGCGLYISDQQNQSWLIYNNLFIHSGGNSLNGLDPIVGVKATDGGKLAMKIYNNTIVESNCATGLVNLIRCDTFYFKNNILILDSADGGDYMLVSGTSDFKDFDSADIDYNHYFDSKGVYLFGETASLSWNGWRKTGYDNHSGIGEVSFMNKLDNSIAGHKLRPGSRGIDEGFDLSSLFDTDIIGIKRPQGRSWDMGLTEQ